MYIETLRKKNFKADHTIMVYHQGQARHYQMPSWEKSDQGRNADSWPTTDLKCYQDFIESYVVNPEAEAISGTWLAMQRAFVEAKVLVTKKDEYDSPLVSSEALLRAQNFMRRVFGSANRSRVPMKVPKVLAGPNGSIDLHWTEATSRFELLINVPSQILDPISFYGDRSDGSSTRGTIGETHDHCGLISWITTSV